MISVIKMRSNSQLSFINNHEHISSGLKPYKPVLTITVNKKGVLDVDTVKGCSIGTKTYPEGGCYGECYAFKNAKRYGIDFTKSVSRQFCGLWHRTTLLKLLLSNRSTWYRVGIAGDPCHDWTHTISILRDFRWSKKIPVVISKHWITLSDKQISDLHWLKATVNTSVSGMDTDHELTHRLLQFNRLRNAGINSILRVVTCKFGNSSWARSCNEKQEFLLSVDPIIDNPLRASKNNPHILNGDILTERRTDSIGGGKLVSLYSRDAYFGHCKQCPDQCGIVIDATPLSGHEEEVLGMSQQSLFEQKVEFIYVPSVIGSGFEKDIAQLAIEDGIAHRAARKNMQIHSAIILKINDEFCGFMTFQNNHDVKEFCLLQSVIRPDKHTDDLYKEMVLKVIEQNTKNYPAIMTTNPKSTFETPKLYKSLGFETYLAMSGFEYMVKGSMADIRMKLLAHMTMVNTWQTTGAEWLKIKKEWNNKIAASGEKVGVENPTFATREGCWQGENGFANVVTGHSHNGNASVLDPVACEIILRFFMPLNGKRIYNPFGGGVQFGFVSGECGYEYIASEIRQNQCDANNKLCSEFANVSWIKSDSSLFHPEGMFDLIFTCPPYYRVEKYIDYDGNPPPGEINHLSNYNEFREALFAGYEIAIEHLNDDCFFVVMTGDSRDSKGAYHCSEAETELFLRDMGLIVYNKIVYIEGAFTRLAHAKKTLNTRKFPKCEQKIITAFKGDPKKIGSLYRNVGRL